ncbi:MAG: PrsW family intramembrane metalloprotease [Bacteroidales bacterium]|nr:PrsW family intramembrane metalloprotease [Candidatus Liminaster caballi]
MQLILVLIAALAPVVVASWYIYKKDIEQPEPTSWLIKAFFFGVLSTFLSFVFSVPLCEIFNLGDDVESFDSIGSAFSYAFLAAAIPEELAKFIMFCFLLRKNPFFDEKFDGIVYAVFVGMGFAGLENIMYLIGGLEDWSWIGTGIVRALFSIPGHFVFAVLMGYYYSLYRFDIDRTLKTKILILGAPILAHGIYDGLLMSVSVNEGLAAVCTIAFLFFFSKLKQKGKEKIESLRNM